MAAAIVQKSAMITCDHQGQTQLQPFSTRVKVAGQSAMQVPLTLVPAGCTLTTPDGTPKPCATITFTSGTTRVRSMGQAFLLDSSTGSAIGPLGNQGGGPISAVQSRVSAQ